MELSWDINTDVIYTRGLQQSYVMRNQRQFAADRQILVLFYRSFVESILDFCFPAWYLSLPAVDKNKLWLRLLTCQGGPAATQSFPALWHLNSKKSTCTQSSATCYTSFMVDLSCFTIRTEVQSTGCVRRWISQPSEPQCQKTERLSHRKPEIYAKV